MKKTLLFIFIFYLLIFALAGTFFYLQFQKNFLGVAASTLEVETVSGGSAIYYDKADIIFRLQVDTVEQFPMTGPVGQFDVDKTNLKAVFEVKNLNGNWELWQALTANFQKEKIAYQGVKELAGLSDFLNPKFSPDNTQLAFVGVGPTFDVLFVKVLATGQITKIGETLGAKISDYSWNKTADQLIFCSSNLAKNACWQAEPAKATPTKTFEKEVKKISWDKTEKIIYLSGEETPHLFSVAADGQNARQLDNLLAPKKIVTFQVDPKGTKIAYEVRSAEKADIYLSNIDGSNRLQITTDGNSEQPLFSTDSLELAILRQKDGIYLIKLSTTDERKILNLTDTIDRLLLWR